MAQEPPPPYNPNLYPPPQPYPSTTQPGYPPQQQAAYPPQQPGYDPSKAPPKPQTTTTTVITQQRAQQLPIRFGEHPVTYTDSSGRQITTQIEYKSGTLTWLIAGGIFLFTGLICLVPIPFCIDATKDVYHINPHDGSVVGVYRRLS